MTPPAETTRTAHIAVDLGAESGRVVLGVLDQGRLELVECHRFEHASLPTPVGSCWDLTGLWREVLSGLRVAAAQAARRGLLPVSVGVDTWGVDWTLLSSAGELLGLPRCYRDPAFPAAMRRVTARVPEARLYAATGTQLLPFNTLFQYAERHAREPRLGADGARLVFLPDVMHWLLCGELRNELTIASTSGMLDARTCGWRRDLLDELGLPTAPLGALTPAGMVLGRLLPQVVAATGLPATTRVVLPPTHDTAAAIAAVPAERGTDWCYLSSGTWSLLGAELAAPQVTAAAAAANFTNELGIDGSVRFLKNITGLWLVQQLRSGFAGDGAPPSYAELTEMAAGVEPLRTLIPVADPRFAMPDDMATAIRDYAAQTGQPVPTARGQLVRCCLESLALEYRRTLEQLERLLGASFEVLHVVGGGSKNGLLNRMTAHATGRRVVVGPQEATAMGNLLTQARGLGLVHGPDGGLAAMRAVVRASIEPVEIAPGGGRDWQRGFERYLALPTGR